MKKLATIFSLLFLSCVMFAQEVTDIGRFNPATYTAGSDTSAPYYYDQGIRTVWVAPDMDRDGKEEVLATDYSNNGRVHVLEMTATGVLEIVWSSPIYDNPGSSIPRWVRCGDLDGDGNMEIIFPQGQRNVGGIQVYEYKGADNDYGTEPVIVLDVDAFVSEGAGQLRQNRETATVYDFDNDGMDELITINEDKNVYVLGLTGEVPGFAGWQMEGVDPYIGTSGGYLSGSSWQSVPADLNGDGVKEIVNHHWDMAGFWEINVTGVDSYEYPDTTLENGSIKFDPDFDFVSYMGLSATDINGDGTEELVGCFYGSGSNDIGIVDKNDNDLQGWDNDPQQFGILWPDGVSFASGVETGGHWGTAAADLDKDGKGEFYIGGSAEFTLTKAVYTGADDGSVFDPANYTLTPLYGTTSQYLKVTYRDSAGVTVDTLYSETPFISKVFAGANLDGDGLAECVLSYQSVADSITYTYSSWRDTSLSYEIDSTVLVENPEAVSIRVIEIEGTVGVEQTYDIVTPADYVLEQNYPNPFNPSTTINFTLPVDKKVSVKVYDMMGQQVATLVNGEVLSKGQHSVKWNATNNSGSKVASGVYIYTLEYGNFKQSQKMTLLK